MVNLEKVIVNEQGLHARPAANFVSKCKQFECAITIEKADKQINCKSLLAVLSASIGAGSTICLCFDGEDEMAAAEVVGGFIDSGCGE